MKILIVSATENEVLPLSGRHLKPFIPESIDDFQNKSVNILITGIGAVPTTYHLTRCALSYDLIINAGIAGSFSHDLHPGSVVTISEDVFSEYGIDNRDQFVPYSNAFKSDANDPLSNPFMSNPWLGSEFKPGNLKRVRGITVATVSGSKERIDFLKTYWNPEVETMESAAVFYTCLNLKIPFICIRSISNLVEPRDVSKWKTSDAIENLCKHIKYYIEQVPIPLK